MAKKATAAKGREVVDQLQKGAPLEPIYYFYGEDPYLLQEALDALRARVNPAFKDFNLHQVSGVDVSGNQIRLLAQQLPIMDTYTLIIVREAHQIEKSAWDQFAPYLEDPSPTTCIAFFDPQKAPEIDRRTKTGRLLADLLVDCPKPFDNQIPRWIMERAKRRQLRIEQMAAERLVELLGTDLPSLDNALERISLYLGKKGQVTEEIIDEVIAENRTYNVFDLSGMIANRDLEGALRLLRGLLHTGEAPLKLLALIVKAFRDLLRARVMVDGGATIKDLDSFIPVRLTFKREERLRAFYQQVRSFSAKEIASAMSLMHQTDLALKSTSGLTEEILMERLILELCRLRIA